MIKYVHNIVGNLLNFPNNINIIAHSCNCQNVMGAGIALQIKDRYPEAYEADCEAAKNNENCLGLFSVAILADDKRIVNLYTQDNYSSSERMVNYEAFYNSLNELVKILKEKNDEGKNYRLGLPYMVSCGLAGGSWKIILSMIEHVATKNKFDIYICKLEK